MLILMKKIAEIMMEAGEGAGFQVGTPYLVIPCTLYYIPYSLSSSV